MKNMLTIYTILCLLVIIYLVSSCDTSRRIEGYEYGSVLCVDNNTTMIVIARGHEEDKEIAALLEMAKDCNK